MKPPLGALDADEFLRSYWQRQPLLIREAFPGFVPELDIDDIAGLACEEMAEARLVSGGFPRHDWRVRYGPFQERDLATLPDHDWTLLVQDVEKHYPPLRELLDRFDFLPRWRLDDLMVSVAAPGGSVGPHVDEVALERQVVKHRSEQPACLPTDEAAQAAFVRHLDSPGRVVIRIEPDALIGFDSEAMFANSPAGTTSTKV